jgi:hypothetical protein
MVQAATPAVVPAVVPAPAVAEPPQYSYSTGNSFSAFPKFNGKNSLCGRNMETQLRTHGQWEVIDRSIMALTPADVELRWVIPPPHYRLGGAVVAPRSRVR